MARSSTGLLLLGLVLFHGDTVLTTETSTAAATTKITNPYLPRAYIVNPHDFSYILNPGYSLCNSTDSPVYLLVYVHTAPKNQQQRSIIRETWATRALFPELRLVFMIGDTPDREMMKTVAYEYETYRDIVQENFIDSYKNLTYKGVMALKWISTYCSTARYVLKVDDDMVVNTFTLIKHLKALDEHRQHNGDTIFCLVWQMMKVMRDSASKWFVSKAEYPLETFSDYCSGSAYILTGDVPAKMYNASLYVPFFWVDDYYITGAVASAAFVRHAQLRSLYSIPDTAERERFMSWKSFYSIMFAHFPASLNDMLNNWRQIVRMQTQRFPRQSESYSFTWNEAVHQVNE